MTTVAEEADDLKSMIMIATRSDRTTEIGKMIDAYLKNTAEMDDRAIHLLFSANRWECA
jgi:thymidylate kinase